jgi:hypothetical protein
LRGRGMNLRHFLTLAALLALTACKPHETWHQKLTLVVETPAGEVSGSAVIAVEGNMRQLPGASNEINYKVRGEAVVVEVAPGKYLFALLGDPSEQFYWAARDRFTGLDREEWLPLIPRQRDPVDLFPDHMPMLVTFADVSRPETVQQVDPLHLSAAFGPGVALKSVRLEITDEAVTEGRVEGVLGWLLEAGKTRFNVAKTETGRIALNEFLSSDHWRIE